MQDKELSPYAKAIYSYLKSYCGNKNECFPSVSKICSDVGICRHTFDKYIKQLVDCGYVLKRQYKEKGRYSRNIYTMCLFFNDNATDVHDIDDHASVDHRVNTNNNKTNKNKNNKNTLYKRETEIKNSFYDSLNFDDFFEKPWENLKDPAEAEP